MTNSSLTNILDEITLLNIEEKYLEIYGLCQSDAFTSNEANEAEELLRSRYLSSRDDVLRSYDLLFMGAVLDSKKFSYSIDQTVEFLISEVVGLNDFRVKDEAGNYVHYLSHATYLASSLLENNLCTNTQFYEIADALFDAYLRCDKAFSYNEDLMLADFLLKIKPSHSKSKAFVQLLSPASAKDEDGRSCAMVQDTNKRMLWMSMFTLNSRYKTYDNSVFSDALTLLIEGHFE